MGKLKSICRRHLPFLSWISNYTWTDALQDGLAGFTVGLAVIPQGIAFASIAGLPAQVRFIKKILVKS